MDNADLLAQKMKYLKRELHNLKTAHFKTATSISTMQKGTSVSFSLMLDSLSGQIFSTQRAIITLDASGSDMISACYLDGATPSNLDSRFVFVNRLSSSAGKVKYEVTVFSQNPIDFQTLIGGGSVDLSYNLKLVGSSRFGVSVAYRSITGGSS